MSRNQPRTTSATTTTTAPKFGTALAALSIKEKTETLLKTIREGKVSEYRSISAQFTNDDLKVIRDDMGRSLLHHSAQNGHERICRLLVEDVELDVNCQDNSGETSLALAAAMGTTGTAKYLIEQGAKHDVRRPNGPAPIHRAACCPDLSMIDLLVAAGSDVSMSSDTGSPLCWAAGAGKHEAWLTNTSPQKEARAAEAVAVVVAMLVLAPCCLPPHWSTNTSPQKEAAAAEAVVVAVVVAMLVSVPFCLPQLVDEHKPAEGDESGSSSGSGSSHGGVRALLLTSALVDEHKPAEGGESGSGSGSSHAGVSALLLASACGSVSSVKLLIEHGANASFKGRGGTTALHAAAAVDTDEALSGLIAELLMQGRGGTTAPAAAAVDTDEALSGLIAELLMKAGASADAEDDEGHTAILLSAARGRRKLVDFLLPTTTPIPGVEWSIDGLEAHANEKFKL
eukprot:gene625-2057_t